MRASYPARTTAKGLHIYHRGAAATAAALFMMVLVHMKYQSPVPVPVRITYVVPPNYLFAKDLNRGGPSLELLQQHLVGNQWLFQ